MRELSLRTSQEQTSRICVGQQLADDVRKYITDNGATTILYVTEEPLLNMLSNYLPVSNEEVLALPSGEDQKTLAGVTKILEKLVSLQAGKDTLLVSFGGGVISDMTGFAAATYSRGVGLVNIPTTLLAMVDAAIGGKNGVDFEGLKNVVGTIYNPSAIFVDTDLLETLPADDLLSGLGELVKAAICFDTELFELLQSPFNENRETIVLLGIQDKIRLVEADPYEQNNTRQLLNFGHSLGHALESLSGFQLKHGQAVAIGCNFAAFVSKEKGYISEEDYQKIRSLIQANDLPLTADFSVSDVIRDMKADKKKLDAETLNFVLIKDIGEGVTEPLAFTEIERYLATFNKLQP